MPAAMDKTKQMSPKQYNDLLGHIDLIDIHLLDLRASLGRNPSFRDKPILEFKEEFSLVQNTNRRVGIEATYFLTAKSQKRKVFGIRAKFAVIFRTDRLIPSEFFDIFDKYSLPLQTFPYLRECANSVVSRMGLPPLVLPLRKYLIGDAD